MGVFPDFGGVGATGDLRTVIGALLMFVLIIAVLMLIVSAIIWAVSASSGNYSAAAKGRVGVLVALGAAVLAGGGVTTANNGGAFSLSFFALFCTFFGSPSNPLRCKGFQAKKSRINASVHIK